MRTKYEYMIQETGHVTEKELNHYGELGWELVQVLPQAYGIIKMVLKREKEETK